MMTVRTEKIPKPNGFGIFVSNLNRKNESALGELGSATCGLQTVLPYRFIQNPLVHKHFSDFGFAVVLSINSKNGANLSQFLMH